MDRERGFHSIDDLILNDGRFTQLTKDTAKRFNETVAGIFIWIVFWAVISLCEIFPIPSLQSIFLFMVVPFIWWKFFEAGNEANQNFLMRKMELELLKEISDRLELLPRSNK